MKRENMNRNNQFKNSDIGTTSFRIVDGVRVEYGIPMPPIYKRGIMRKLIKSMRVGESFVCARGQAMHASVVAKSLGLKISTRIQPNQTRIQFSKQKVRVFLLGPLDESIF